MSDEALKGLEFLDADDEANGVLAYAVDRGDFEEAEVAKIWKRFDDAATAGKKIRIYAEMRALPSVQGVLVVEKLKRIATIMSVIERMAIVGDQGWLQIYARLIDPITKPDIKHFTSDQRDEALAWVKG